MKSSVFGYGYLIGIILICIGLIIFPAYSTVGTTSFWFGLIFVWLSYLKKKNKLYLPISIQLMIEKIKDKIK